jgi:hypothetical protein
MLFIAGESAQMRSRWEIDREIYQLIKGKSVRVMFDLCWSRFKKASVSKLTNDQAETLLVMLKDKYNEIARKRLSDFKQGADPK